MTDVEYPDVLPLGSQLPPGYGITYSTDGPSDAAGTRVVTLPRGLRVEVPANATNIATAFSPPPTAEDRMMQQFSSMPIGQAQQAYEAAMKFQVMRGFQRDIENGMPDAEAFNKWMPKLFMYSGKGALNGTQAAAMMKATTPPPQYKWVEGQNGAPSRFEAPGQRPVFAPTRKTAVVNGQLLEVPPTGQPIALTPERQVAPKPTVGESALARGEASALVKQLAMKEQELADTKPRVKSGFLGLTGEEIDNPEYITKQQEIDDLKARIRGIDTKQPTEEKPKDFAPPPPLGQRVPNKVYKTPKGLYTWTGKGWKPYAE